MTLQQYEAVYEIFNTGSYLKAASNLFLTQPQIRTMIRDLEAELGIRIFSESERGVQLTTDGRQLYDTIAPMVNKQRDLKTYYHAGAGSHSTKFCISSLHFPFVSNAVSRLVDETKAERSSIRLMTENISDIITDVAQGYSELGIFYLSDNNRNHLMSLLDQHNLEFHTIVETRPYVYFSKNHPLAKHSSILEQELTDYPYVSFDQRASLPLYFPEEMIPENFAPASKTVYINDSYSLFDIIMKSSAYTLGSGILPRTDFWRNLVCIPLADSREDIEIIWVKKRSQNQSLTAYRFLTILNQILQEQFI